MTPRDGRARQLVVLSQRIDLIIISVWNRGEADKAKRADQYKQIQEIYMKAAPIIFLYQTPYPVALRKNVKGFVQIPLGQNIFAGASVEK